MFGARRTGTLTGIDLGLAPPPAHRLLRDTEFAGHRLDRLELRNIRGFHHGVQQPQRTLTNLRRILTGHAPDPPIRIGTKPGALHATIATVARRLEEFRCCAAGMREGRLSLDQVGVIAARAAEGSDEHYAELAAV